MICENIQSIDGKLHFAGMNTIPLVKKYGTPLYLMDEDRIRENCRTYKNALPSCRKTKSRRQKAACL